MSYFITGFYNQYSTLLYSSSIAFPVAAPCPGTIIPPTQSTPITSKTAFLLCVPCLCGFSCVLSHLTTLRHLLLAFSASSLSTHKSKATGLAEAGIQTSPVTLCNPSKAFTCSKGIMTVKPSISSTGAVLKFSVMSQYEKQQGNREGTAPPLYQEFQASTAAS